MDTSLRADGLYFLKRNPLFGPLGEDVLQELVSALKILPLPQGSVMAHAGTPSEGVYIIRTGRARITSHEEGEEPKTIAFLGRGDTVGELSLMTGEPHPYSVISETACELLVLAKSDWDAVLEKHPLVAIHLSRALSRRLAVTFRTPRDKPIAPQIVSVVPALPHEAIIIVTVNLAMAILEQTRRRVLLLDFFPRNGDLARSLNLPPPPGHLSSLRDDDLLDMHHLHRHISMHASGLEVLSLPPGLIKNHLLDDIPPFLNLLKEHYDFILVLPPIEEDPMSEIILPESDRILFITWDQTPELVSSTLEAHEKNLTAHQVPHYTVHLQDPDTKGGPSVDYRIPWIEQYHLPFRSTGNPYLAVDEAKPALKALERVARALGKLRIGLAMGSGAAYGYAIVGLLKVFEREGIPIDLVAGTSMGALLGSMFCAGMSPQRIQETSQRINKRWLYENILGDLTLPRSGFLAGHTLHAFLREVLGLVEFSQLPIPFAAVATDIRTGQEVVLREGRVADAVRASTSLPVIFKPYLHRGQYLVDGGLVNPVPTSTVAHMGADILISLNLTAKPSVRKGVGHNGHHFPLAPRAPNAIEVFFKMIYTMQYEIAQARTEIAHVVIAPDMRDFLWTEFHRSEEILKVGEAAAEAAIPQIKSLLPFFKDFCQISLSRRTTSW